MATLITENFNSCLVEDLDTNAGCTGWSGDTDFDVENTQVKEGANAVQVTNAAAGGDSISKDGGTVTTGKQTFYVRKTATNSGAFDTEFVSTTLATPFAIRIQTDGTILLDGGTDESLGSYTADAWHSIEVEWTDVGGRQVRARLNGGTWTNWLTYRNANDPRYVYFYVVGVWAAGDIAYFDYLAEEPLAGAATPNAVFSATNF